MPVDIQAFSHIGIRVHDLDTSCAFYAKLGFERVAGPLGPEPVAILEHPAGIELNLVINAHDDCRTNVLMDVPEKHPGFTHLALRVPDLDAARAELERQGIELSGQMRFPFGSGALFVRDPDGNTVELNDVQPGVWHTVDPATLPS